MAGIDLVAQAGLATRLSDCGVELEKLAQLAKDAETQWTGKFNPRDLNESALLELYQAAY